MKPTAVDLLERDFSECRARLLDLAAFLDRLERYDQAGRAKGDVRYQAIGTMLEVLCSGRPGRVVEILTRLSDPTGEPGADLIPPGKAVGAWRGSDGG